MALGWKHHFRHMTQIPRSEESKPTVKHHNYHACPSKPLHLPEVFCFLLSSLTFHFSPTARWGSLDFIRGAARTPPLRQLRAPHLSGHCRTSTANACGTSTASSRSQWALPDLNRAPDFSGHSCILSRHSRTVAASARSQWALPDLNRELQTSVGSWTSKHW